MARWGEIVSSTDLGANQTVRRNATDDGWEVFTPSSGGALNDLTDVTITTPSTDQVLKYNGSGWVNGAASGSGLTQQQVEGII